MPDVLTSPPARESYEYVLANFRYHPDQPHFEAIPSEHATARSIEWPAGIAVPVAERSDLWHFPRKPGDRVSMMFVRERFLFERLRKLGWVDVTQAWNDGLGDCDPPAIPVAPPPLSLGAPVGEKASGRHRGTKATDKATA